MKKNIILLGLFTLILIMPLIYADETQIIVKTLPDHNYTVSLTVLNPDTEDAYADGRFENSTNSAGDAFFTYSSASKRIGFSVIVRQNGRIAMNKKLGINSTTTYTTGGTITLNLFDAPATAPVVPSPIVNISNQTNNTNSTNNITNAVNNTVTIVNATSPAPSFSFFSSLKFDWKKVLIWTGIIIGGIIIIIAVILFVIFIGKKMKNILSNRKSKKKPEDVVVRSVIDQDIKDAERKIKEAEMTIDFMKIKKDKIIEAKRKFEEAKKELDRLREY